MNFPDKTAALFHSLYQIPLFGKSRNKAPSRGAYFTERLVIVCSSRTQYETPLGTRLGFTSIDFTECLQSLHNNHAFEFVSCLYELFWGPSED